MFHKICQINLDKLLHMIYTYIPCKEFILPDTYTSRIHLYIYIYIYNNIEMHFYLIN